ncbi:MAG: preprotein translocase subunit SecG [Bacteroidales bacterium]
MVAYVVVAVLIIITCVLLTLIVLVQSSKGGGLASNFSSSNQFMGVRKTADFLEKATWTLAVSLLVLSLFSIFVIPRGTQVDPTQVELQEKYKDIQPVQDFVPPPQATGQDAASENPEE